MIIINENAEAKLVTALANLRSQPASGEGLACLVHVELARLRVAQETAAHFQQIIAARVRAADIAIFLQVYVCEDGDMFILVPCALPGRIRTLVSEIESQLPRSESHSCATLYELNLHRNRLLVLLEGRIADRQNAREALRKKQLAEEAEHRRESILNSGAVQSTVQAIAARRRQRSRAEIMLIEDDPFSRRLVENVLQRRYSLTALSSADVALSAYAHTAPDVLFLDINLPDVTGHELLEKIMALDPEAYVVMLSGSSDRENILRAMSKGAKGFVGKPFSGEKLFQYIRNCPTIRDMHKGEHV